MGFPGDFFLVGNWLRKVWLYPNGSSPSSWPLETDTGWMVTSI
jgi:hypothetical protein